MNTKEQRDTMVDGGTPLTYLEKEAVAREPQPYRPQVTLICESVGEALWDFLQTEGV